MSLALVDERRPVSVDQLADAAVDALLAEARLTPKPGLVDRRGAGAHHDMTVGLLERSARSLRPTFAALAASGTSGPLDQTMRARLAAIGRSGERVMLTTTSGVNTHRGAIWALGLSVAVRANDSAVQPPEILARVGRLARFADPTARVAPAASNGARARHRYGVVGAVGAARDGFPAAATALEALRSARAAGQSEANAQLCGLLASVAVLDDTCLLHRGGLAGLHLAQHSAAQILDAGGPTTPAGNQLLARLDRDLAARRLSPGGSADMLALAVFLDAVAPRHPTGR